MKKKLLPVTSILFTLFFELPVEAVHEISSDTGAEFFDFIENRRRERRQNQLSEEQEKLIEDIVKAKEELKHEIKEGEPIPAVFRGR